MTIPSYYPQGYRLGFDMILWIVFIILVILFGFYFLLKAYKTDLINRKEIYFFTFIFYLFLGFKHISYQMAFLYPNSYNLFMSLGLLFFSIGFISFYYLWEKNLINFNRIYLRLYLIVIFIQLFEFFYVVIVGEVIPNLFFSIYIIAILMSFGLFFLVLKFIKQVIGPLRIYGLIVLLGIILFDIGSILYMFLFVSIVSPLISPILLIASFFFYFYGMKGISDGLSTFYNQAHMCIIHKGKIAEGNQIYYCPSCKVSYCKKCYEEVVINDGCWNCGHGITENAHEWKTEIIDFGKKI